MVLAIRHHEGNRLLALAYVIRGSKVIGYQDIEDIQEALDKNFPSPEEDLLRIAQSVGSSPNSIKRYAEIRFSQFEVDSLLPQLRWHIGQALSLYKSYPKIAEGEQYSTTTRIQACRQEHISS